MSETTKISKLPAGEPAMRKQPLFYLFMAVGKTRMSLDIAKAWNAEIISGDSMQVYRGMDIGTAKIPFEEREGIPHHLIDIRDPEEAYSAADFQENATQAIKQIAHLEAPFYRRRYWTLCRISML